MKSFFKVKSVGSGMTRLLDDFCKKENLISPVKHTYGIDDRITFGSWLTKLKFVDQQYKEDGLGLDIAALINPSYIGISAYISNSCEKLSDILHNSLKYNKIWYNYMPRTVIYAEGEIHISWGKPAYLQAGLYVHETAVSEELQIAIFFTRLQQIFDDENIRFSCIQFAIPRPKNIKKYEEFFKCPVEFDTAETKIFLPISALELKIKKNDSVLFEILKKQADEILASMSSDDSFIETVNQNILLSIHHNNAHLGYVAEKMNISGRVLQNYLKDRNLCFKELLSKMRFNLAKQYLANPSLSILDVSFLLAYHEQTSFNRAFKKWVGYSPTQWREINTDIQN